MNRHESAKITGDDETLSTVMLESPHYSGKVDYDGTIQ